MDKKIENIAIVTPVFNEEKYLKKFIKKIIYETKQIDHVKKIIIVNDGSTDKTQKILDKFSKLYSFIFVIKHSKNRGKGAALRTGLNFVKKQNFDGVIFIDADQQHEPRKLKQFVKKLETSSVVFGYRNLDANSPFLRKLGNQTATFIVRNMFHLEKKDLLCGYMAFRKEIFEKIKWKSDDYGVETEISTIMGIKRIPFEEVNVKNIYLDKKKGVNLLHAGLILLRIPIWYFSLEKIISTAIMSLILIMFLLLSYRDAYGVRSLVPNLEPYPDTLYYAAPAWNFVKGNGFKMFFNGYTVKNIVPPIYSIYLIPFFAIFRDVRSFYFANLLLGIGSLVGFFLVVKKIFDNKFTKNIILATLGFFLITNFYFYNLPAYLMAENITTFLIIWSIYLLLGKPSRFQALIAGFIGVIFWMVKLSNLSFGLIFYVIYLTKIIFRKNNYDFVKFFLSVVILSTIGFIFYLIKSDILIGHEPVGITGVFSSIYFINNFRFYLNSLIGGETKYLWFNQLMVSRLIGELSLLGLVIGLIDRKTSMITLIFFLFIISVIIYMSFFYVPDLRYIISILPLWVLSMGFLINFIFNHLGKNILNLFTILILICYLLTPFFSQLKNEKLIISIKKQIGLNVKHQETPWNYIAVKNFNSFFETNEEQGVYLGTFLPPYFVNFYTNHKYQYLPIIQNQDFYPGKGKLLEQMKITNLIDYYKKLIKKNKKIYVSNYFDNNLHEWQAYFYGLRNHFQLQLVKKGCYEECNIYRVKNKF